MKVQDIKKLIENETIPDEEVLEALKKYTTDTIDEKGELVPSGQDDWKTLEDLYIVTKKLRPGVIEQFRQDFLKEHGENHQGCR
ncbi:MAG: DUF3189 family protein [Parcubacteria group bacterium]|nr:DUF3189 family protein [Parcubacteria group bacterium]